MPVEIRFGNSSYPIVLPWWIITTTNWWKGLQTAMLRNSVQAIQGRWSKGMSWVHTFGSAAFPALAIACLASSLSAQSVSSLGQTYRKDLSPANRAALIRFAAAHPKDTSGALAMLVTAAGDLERKAFSEALTAGKGLEVRLPA